MAQPPKLHTLLTLVPNDKKDNQVFQEYRCNELVKAFDMLIIYVGLQELVMISIYAGTRDKKSAWDLALISFLFATYLLGWFIGKRCK